MLKRIAPRPDQFASHVTIGDSRRIATALRRKLLFFMRGMYRTTMNHSVCLVDRNDSRHVPLYG